MWGSGPHIDFIVTCAPPPRRSRSNLSMPVDLNIIFARILAFAAEQKASDIHFSVGNPPAIRKDGELQHLNSEQVVTPDIINGILEVILSPEARARFDADKEVAASYVFQGGLRFRVDVFQQAAYPSVSMRLIPAVIPSLESLGLPPVVQRMSDLSRGLVLVVGPYGAGKSTVLAAMVDRLNRERAHHIVTIEYPVEYLFQDAQSVVEQREVGRDTHSFEQALAAIRRQDADTILVSHMENPSVIREVLDLAEAGHAVYGAMETGTAVETIEKILGSFSENEQMQIQRELAHVLRGILAVRLVPRAGGGRILVAEALVNTTAVARLIREGTVAQLQNILETSRDEGMMSLDQALAAYVRAGEILPEKAEQFAVDPEHFRELSV